jgi:hypothetical protein
MGISSIRSSALAAPNLKDLPRTFAHERIAFWWAIMPKRGNSPSPCNGLFALEGLSFATACGCSPTFAGRHAAGLEAGV